jgi:hypothetical protein
VGCEFSNQTVADRIGAFGVGIPGGQIWIAVWRPFVLSQIQHGLDFPDGILKQLGGLFVDRRQAVQLGFKFPDDRFQFFDRIWHGLRSLVTRTRMSSKGWRSLDVLVPRAVEDGTFIDRRLTATQRGARGRRAPRWVAVKRANANRGRYSLPNASSILNQISQEGDRTCRHRVAEFVRIPTTELV